MTPTEYKTWKKLIRGQLGSDDKDVLLTVAIQQKAQAKARTIMAIGMMPIFAILILLIVGIPLLIIAIIMFFASLKAQKSARALIVLIENDKAFDAPKLSTT